MTNLITFALLLGVPTIAYWIVVRYDVDTPRMAGDPQTALTGPGRAARIDALAMLPNSLRR